MDRFLVQFYRFGLTFAGPFVGFETQRDVQLLRFLVELVGGLVLHGLRRLVFMCLLWF